MSSAFAKSGESTVPSRFEYVLRGRRASPWGEWVGLSQGTLNRLKKGSLPDPEKLTVACRAENLSLSWLLDGLGAPYLVNACADTNDACALICMLIADEPTWHPLFASSSAGATIVLHQPATISAGTDNVCNYRASAVIAGRYDFSTVVRETGLCDHAAGAALEIGDDDWRRLASGFMSNTELFGWRDAPGGLFRNALPTLHYRTESITQGMVREESGDWLRPIEREVADLLRQMNDAELDVVMRMLRGVKR